MMYVPVPVVYPARQSRSQFFALAGAGSFDDEPFFCELRTFAVRSSSLVFFRPAPRKHPEQGTEKTAHSGHSGLPTRPAGRYASHLPTSQRSNKPTAHQQKLQFASHAIVGRVSAVAVRVFPAESTSRPNRIEKTPRSRLATLGTPASVLWLGQECWVH